MLVSEQRDDSQISNPRGLSFSVWCIAAAFGTYFCMYGFRKPFTAGAYSGQSIFNIDYKTVLVVAQVLGYLLSKLMGIKFVSEIPPNRRAICILLLIAGAQLALFLFGATPVPYNFVWLFCNGLFLGMVFGLVLGFLEGRTHTEALAAGLCTSFIVADGLMKTLGNALLSAGVTENWMPFTAGLVFTPPLLISVWMLSRIPSPSQTDVAARTERVPMDGKERGQFFRRYAAGLTLIIFMYLLITILRSIRADFAPEIWLGMKAAIEPSVFARSEFVVAFGVLLINGSAVFIRGNRNAFFAGLSLIAVGCVLTMAATLGLQAGHLSPFAFMVFHGLGLYLPYIAIHTTLFERLIAMTRDRGNIGYLMYLADAVGYLGYVAVLISRKWLAVADDFVTFFIAMSWIVSVSCIGLLIPCWRYFAVMPSLEVQSSLKTEKGAV